MSQASSLLTLLLDRSDLEKMETLIGILWMLRDNLAKSTLSDDEIKMKDRIVELWRHLYEKYKAKTPLTSEDQAILSHLAKLTIFLEEINEENFQWLVLSARYVQINFNSPFFIKYLNQLKAKGEKLQQAAIDVGYIFQKMLKHFTPDYNKEHIRKIVEHLFKQGNKAAELAKEICNTYGKRGQEFLWDLYEKYKT